MKRIAFLGFALILAACSPNEPDTATNTTVPLGSPVQFGVHEDLTAAGRSIRLDGATEQIYGCVNYRLLVRELHLPRASRLEIDGVSVPSICLTALGPAKASIPLGDLPAGIHSLRIAARGTEVEGTLVTSPDSIVIVGGEGPWTKFPTRVLHRVPPGTIWGMIGWGPEDRSSEAQAFLTALEASGAQPLVLAPGEYDYFSVAADGTVLAPPNRGYYFSRAFAYRMPGDRGAVPGLIVASDEHMWVSTFGDRGESWLSWVLRPSVATATIR